MNFKDACKVLGVCENEVTPQTAKKARNTLLLKYHPDKTREPHEIAINKSYEINEAYAYLDKCKFLKKNEIQEQPYMAQEANLDSQYPLHNMAQYGSIKEMEELLAQEHDINELNAGISVIKMAVLYMRSNEFVNFLISKGANIYDYDLLQEATRKGYYHLVDSIMANVSTYIKTETHKIIPTNGLPTTLHIEKRQLTDILCDAVLFNQFWIVKLLVNKYQLNLNGNGSSFSSPVTSAVHRADETMLDFIASHGAFLPCWQQKTFFDLQKKVPSALIKQHWLGDALTQLNNYVQDRQSQCISSGKQFYFARSLLSFFGYEQPMYSAKTKISAAEKLIKFIERTEKVTFTENELLALQEGKLGTIVSSCMQTGLSRIEKCDLLAKVQSEQPQPIITSAL